MREEHVAVWKFSFSSVRSNGDGRVASFVMKESVWYWFDARTSMPENIIPWRESGEGLTRSAEKRVLTIIGQIYKMYKVGS